MHFEHLARIRAKLFELKSKKRRVAIVLFNIIKKNQSTFSHFLYIHASKKYSFPAGFRMKNKSFMYRNTKKKEKRKKRRKNKKRTISSKIQIRENFVRNPRDLVILFSKFCFRGIKVSSCLLKGLTLNQK